MKLNQKAELVKGTKKVFTHLVFAAHQDDIEIMCGDGILKGYHNEDCGFTAVVVADGAGSPRDGAYAHYTNEEMMKIRREEQIAAAQLGNYADLALLNYTSKEIKDNDNTSIVNDMLEILKNYKPKVVYTHNLADKHPTHVSVTKKVIKAIRQLPMSERPEKLYGCEVWRALDWVSDSEKIVFDLSNNDQLLLDLLAVFDSQIAGGKRYDLATQGRRIANATYAASHGVDLLTQASYGMDLTPLIKDDSIDPKQFILDAIGRFVDEILV